MKDPSFLPDSINRDDLPLIRKALEILKCSTNISKQSRYFLLNLDTKTIEITPLPEIDLEKIPKATDEIFMFLRKQSQTSSQASQLYQEIMAIRILLEARNTLHIQKSYSALIRYQGRAIPVFFND